MPGLMDQHMRDEMLERVIAVGPFVEDRTAEQADAVGQCPRMLDAAFGQRDSFVDAGEVERVLDPHRFQGIVVGEFLDQQHDIAEVRRERLGQALQRAPGERFDLVGRWWGPEVAHRRGHRGKANAPARLPLAREALTWAPFLACGAVAEWSKALAWKVSIRQKRIEGSNPSRSAIVTRR